MVGRDLAAVSAMRGRWLAPAMHHTKFVAQRRAILGNGAGASGEVHAPSPFSD
jgi:hypothetical protein